MNHNTLLTHEVLSQETLEPKAEITPEVVQAVDEVFVGELEKLASARITPEMESGLGFGVKEAIPDDRTQGIKSWTGAR